MSESKQFTDEEVRMILARAAERQELVRPTTTDEHINLEQVREIAREAGIDSHHVDAAATEVVASRDTPVQVSRSGLPKEIGDYRYLPSRVTDAEWEQIVNALREAYGLSGIVTQFGEVREWVSSSDAMDTAPVRVRLAPRGEGMELTIVQKTGELRAIPMASLTLLGMAAGLATFLGMGTFEPRVFALPAVIGGAGAVMMAGGLVWGRSWMRKQRLKIQALLDRIDLLSRGQ